MAAVSEAGAIVRQGHLRKLKTMKKKFFVLRAETSDCSARLEYYESEKKFRSGSAPRRVLSLKSCYNITRRLDLKQKHVIALFTREEQLCIVAENEQDLHAWLAAILKLFRNDDASAELLHPIQHVWQVNVQKKGLGASKSIQGLYNLCLTDKTLTLVKIKSHNNIISDLVIPERVEYSLKNIRRCGDSECFFYMEVGRQTSTGAGELWMHSDDSNIAQSMHSTIYHAMMNCAKESENEKDHIVVPGKSSLLESSNPLPARRQTYSDGRGRAGLYNEKGLCVGACIRQCVCASATYSIDDSAAAVPTNDVTALRNRCETMPSRACSSFESDRPQITRHTDVVDGLASSRDDIDSISEWYRTPRIPEEPDGCEYMLPRDFMSMRTGSIAHSRTSSMGVDDGGDRDVGDIPDGYLPMGPPHLSSSASVCSGTPSTDPRFSEYQLEPATSHISEERSTRAYSVGSRPVRTERVEPASRLRAYSAGARRRPAHARPTDDLMEIDFSANSPQSKPTIARTPPTHSDIPKSKPVDEYVDMSPRNAGYVEMKPGEPFTPIPSINPISSPMNPLTPPDGYVEMSYRSRTRPIAITNRPSYSSPDSEKALHGSQTIFPFSPDSPPEMEHALSTVREISEEGRDGREGRVEVSSSPQYVTLARPDCLNNNKTARIDENREGGRLHYAALDLEERTPPVPPPHRLYTQIDFARSETYAADAL
ncbi:insulin receptor substrate 1-like isoform X5 [Pieris napi]|uniref:insulin receptor substrate 1-like isoform X5 n=1 Tax=Pieris napi TaxID=78633 RepID=UPI001FBBBB6A|nr:insulin receptor substrate 1-like isoform X5 [Pieris napi]